MHITNPTIITNLIQNIDKKFYTAFMNKKIQLKYYISTMTDVGTDQIHSQIKLR